MTAPWPSVVSMVLSAVLAIGAGLIRTRARRDPTRSRPRLRLCPAPLVILMAAATVEADEATHSFLRFYDKTGKTVRVSDEAFYKLLNKQLGKNYQSLQVVVSACNSGGFANQAFVAPALEGVWSTTAARDVQRGLGVEPSFDKQMQKNFTENRMVDGLPIGQTDGKNLYWYSYPPSFAKTVFDMPNAGFKDIATKATDNDAFLPTGEPTQYAESGADAGKRTLHSGTGANQAIVFAPFRVDQTDYIVPKTIEALGAAGYKIDNTDPAKSEVSFLYGDSKVGDKIGKEAGKEAVVTGLASYDAFTTTLADLNKQLTANGGKESALIDVWTHGEEERRTDARQPGGPPGAPGDGIVLHNDSTLSLTLDSGFLHNLFLDVPDGKGGVFFSDPLVSRTGQPEFLFTTVAESTTAPVQVLLDNISLGFLPTHSSGSGDYVLELSNGQLLQLEPLLMSGPAIFSFEFANASDFLKLATSDDFYLDPSFSYDHYGLGLTTGFAYTSSSVPEPPTLLSLAMGVLAASLASTRRVQGRPGDRANRGGSGPG